MRRSTLKSILFTSTLAGFGTISPASAQSSDAPPTVNDIVVTARRSEERLQDVPISIQVLNQQDLANRNIVNASDLSTTTPGLITNQRFGPDASSFAIRGFTQELRTSASVAVYFADVVAPRGGTLTTSGDGAGPGAFFDLENVQVLKGPQGTLFGRNTTGGAVLLVPKRPDADLGGYVQGSVGNFDMWRVQGVLNIPINENVRFRVGADHQKRDGYLRNVTGIGHSRFADMDYVSVRASLVLDLTPDLENYTVATFMRSENSGSPSSLFACNAAAGLGALVNGPLCGAALAQQGGDYYAVSNIAPQSVSESRQWQIINRTTWQATDALTIKNIASFGNLRNEFSGQVFGTGFNTANMRAPAVATPPQALPYSFTFNGSIPGLPLFNVDTFVEELQFQGRAAGDRLTWQAGIYYEKSSPRGTSAGNSAGNIGCDFSTLYQGDPANFRCRDIAYDAVLPILVATQGPAVGGLIARQAFSGSATQVFGDNRFEDVALYAQGTYKLTDKLSATLGFRYTWDKASGQSRALTYRFSPDALSAPLSTSCSDSTASLSNGCLIAVEQKSDAPTWLIDLDYKPNQDILLYAKYARGYRQGGVNIAGVAAQGLNKYGQEKVDTYEVGGKTQFRGALRGTFNVALFYNDFADQQVQAGLLTVNGNPTTAIVNAGASTIYGAEVVADLELFRGFTLSGSYSYLHTKVDEFTPINPALLVGVLSPLQPSPSYTTAAGEPLSFSPEHQFALTGTYRLPLPERVGQLSVSGTYAYTAKYQAVLSSVSPYATIPGYGIANLNVNWNRIGGSPVDVAFFGTNMFNKKYYTFIGGQYNSTGFEYRQVGQPRMYGLRLTFNFGG
ncbi:TonB-dependent receptor [Novosphingobium sp. G106]|uniref:TonB-dependent receptor n=1 Tax=Novosphingobium sp. G106 TaxID=2849500 RepID=UPI001C2D75A4|nr:TonB-dependent receptor [Novosphingobium sp. G106]MBV1687177.1 TonB-dependent receptor [Novosphingobium sp. G106]